ncbi:hypothetical protein B0I37DRAFT_139209 [Chaetomium sp. MPI-CAGE-AT-0009]|nr:hypothetical protein B0I37DRAFT_139209 [Chaetomium sp. MPI-CAGE-AT-0009]
MTVFLSFGAVVLFPRAAAALSSAEEWSDFADNFATDLAPLITLFGEQVTKQFLSESIGILDNIIFGLAPLGILTALVSAIRLYGRASLKSFIGRAQEAHGVAEAELCSSTSHDVCELWSNGGICRVFGRPKILEFIYVKGDENVYPGETWYGTPGNEPPLCGIYLPNGYLVSPALPDSERWTEVGERRRRWRRWGRRRRPSNDLFAPFPNLSLNVGTRRTSKKFLLAAVAAGLLLETSFFVYATWATFYNPGFYTEDDEPQLWSFVLAMAGTVALMCGMSLCAILVERRSTERRFIAPKKPDGSRPRIFWLQCGDQRVGDQQFRSFAYSAEKDEYMTSYIHDPDFVPIFGLPPRIVLWAAIVLSLLGFVCQFVGLRGLHGSIILYQLACTLVMSVIRALLRSRRLGREQNRLEGLKRSSDSDELDWQALAIVSDDYPIKNELAGSSPRRDTWSLVNSHLDTGLIHSLLSKTAQAELMSSKVDMLLSKGDVGSGVVGFRPVGDPPGEIEEHLCREGAVKFIRMMVGDMGPDNLAAKPLEISGARDVLPDFGLLNPAARIVNIRARLGSLTGEECQPTGMQWDPELQATARRLQKALGEAVGYIFRKAPLQSGWKGAGALAWSAACEYKVAAIDVEKVYLTFPVQFLALRKGQQWIINEYHLAAVMSLWRNAILRLYGPPGVTRALLEKRKIMQATGGPESAAAIIRLWVAKERPLEQRVAGSDEDKPASLVPFRLSVPEVFRAIRTVEQEWKPYEDEAAVSDDLGSNPIWLLSLLSTSGSLLDMIAQDIFTIFMFEIASIMEQLTEVSVRQPGDNTTLRNANTTSSELSNTHIDELARILCDAGLATEEAALMCIIPALFHHGKLPSLDDSVARLLDDGRKLRTDRQYEKGAAHLKSLLSICSPQHHENVLRALGELFRHALRSPSAVHRDFGLQAMESLGKDMVRQGAPTLLDTAMVALSDYESLAEFLNGGSRGPGNLWNSKARPNLGISQVLELHKGLDQPEERSHLKTLLLLEKYDMTGHNNSAIHELLFVAIALGHLEVLEDLRALNHDLIFEVPSLAPLPEDPPCSSASIASKFNANHLAQAERSITSGFNANHLAQAESRVRPASTVGFLATAWAASQLEHEEGVPGQAEAVLRMMLDWASVTKDFTDGYNNTPLIYAVSSGNIKAVDILLEYGADFQIRNTTGETALSRAVKVGHLSIAERILKEGQERANLPHVYLHHALVAALIDHKRDFIELLLRNGTIIDDPGDLGETLLSKALRPFWNEEGGFRRDPVLVSLLLEHGATVGDRLSDILQAAVDNLEAEWIRHLHARGHDVVGSPILKRGLAAVLELDKPNERDLDRDCSYAPKKRHQTDALIRVLFDIGMPVQPGDLHQAVRLRPSDDVLAVVLEKGTGNNTVLEDYGTPLQTLLNHDLWDGPGAEQESFLDMMLQAGCDPNLDSPAWKATPLQIACSCSEASARTTMIYPREPFTRYSDSDNIAMILVRTGANVNLTAADIPGDGQRLIRSTPLELACLTGKTEVVKALIKAGANVNTPGGEFGPPLQAACLHFGQRRLRHSDAVEIVRALIKAGADANAVTEPCRTALAAAALSLLPELVHVLLSEAGADPRLRLPSKPPNSLFPELLSTFGDIQTGRFEPGTMYRNTAACRQAADQIVGLYADHGVTLSPDALIDPENRFQYQHICFQHEFSARSPEEIRLADYTDGPHYGPETPPVMERDTGSMMMSSGGTFNLLGPVEPPFPFRGLGGGGADRGLAFGRGPWFADPGTSIVGTGFGREGSVASTSNPRGFGSFGSSSSTPGGGLFGLRADQAGLFGYNSRGSGDGGLFGSNSTAQGGSLFGSRSTTQGGGLFGSSPTQGGSLFGSSSGLFGSNSGGGGNGGFGSPTQGGGLFGSSPTQGGGLFGSSSTTQGGGLFGSNSSGGGFGAFGSSSSFGTGGLFGSNSAQGGFGLNSLSQGSLFGSNAQAFGSNTLLPPQSSPEEGGDTGPFGSGPTEGGFLWEKTEGNGLGAAVTPGDVIDTNEGKPESGTNSSEGGVAESNPEQEATSGNNSGLDSFTGEPQPAKVTEETREPTNSS